MMKALILLISFMGFSLIADVRLPHIITDDMVLQRNAQVPI